MPKIKQQVGAKNPTKRGSMPHGTKGTGRPGGMSGFYGTQGIRTPFQSSVVTTANHHRRKVM